MDGYIDFFHLLGIVHKTAIKIGVLILLWNAVINSFEHMPKSRIRLCGNLNFNF